MATKDTKSVEESKDEQQQQTQPEAAQASQTTTEWLMGMMKRSLGLADKKDYPEQLVKPLDFDGLAEYIKSGKCKNIITMAGAGISTSAGIPDFRSPGSGLYDNLQKYNLPSPQAIFDINFFEDHPEPFFHLAKELWPGIFKPTVCHYFVKLLAEKGLLLRHYSQNIDTLERVAGIDGEKLVEAHGTFHTAHCINPDCKRQYSKEWVKERVFADTVPTCEADDCVSIVKPDIVFFGEPLPKQFFTSVKSDMGECDLLLIMGTSLVVQPFASLTSRVPEICPRVYINLEKTSGSSDPMMALLGMGHGFRFDEEDNYRDIFWQGTCDDGCLELAKKLGWEKELNKMVSDGHKAIEEMVKAEKRHAKEIEAKSKKSGSPDAKAQDKASGSRSTPPKESKKSNSASKSPGVTKDVKPKQKDSGSPKSGPQESSAKDKQQSGTGEKEAKAEDISANNSSNPPKESKKSDSADKSPGATTDVKPKQKDAGSPKSNPQESSAKGKQQSVTEEKKSDTKL